MKTVKEGKQPTEFWPFNRDIHCHHCGAAYRLEEGKDEGFIQVNRVTDYRGDEDTNTSVQFPCPNCGHHITSYPQRGDVIRSRSLGKGGSSQWEEYR